MLGEWLCLIVVMWVIAEIAHHYYYINQVKKIDQIYAQAPLDRDVDIVDLPFAQDYEYYWSRVSEGHKATVFKWASEAGMDFEKVIKDAINSHISNDHIQGVDPGNCLPLSFLFRSYNTLKIFLTGLKLRKLGFKSLYLECVDLHYYSAPDEQNQKPLLIIYPQFSGEFSVLAIFTQLRHKCDILFVAPRCVQLTWNFTPCRHSDALEEYLPIVLKYKSVYPLCWSAGNLSFQVLDRYLQQRGMRDKIKAVVRLDPLGYPTSNFLVYSGATLPWSKLYSKFLQIGSHVNPAISLRNHFGCLGLSYLLKSSHGYTYVKLGRMLRVTKLVPAPYPEFLITASFDPTWAHNHPFFENDRTVLFAHVSEESVEGFHGLWINHQTLKVRVLPILMKLLD